MAAGGSYKQQCPSCEAMVLIKDATMVGKKIDCPQCKYRFVVQKAAGGAAGEEEANGAAAPKSAKPTPAAAKGKSDQAVTAKKPSGAPTAPQLKKKPATKKTFDADDDDTPAVVEKEPSGSRVMMMMVGVSVLAVALLGVGGYFLFFRDTDSPPNTGPVAVRPTARKEVAKGVPAAKADLEVTNLLPNDTQAVINLSFKDLRDSSAGRAAFESPGAFTADGVAKQLGVHPKDVDQILVALNRGAKPWTFAVIRSSKAFDVKALKASHGNPDEKEAAAIKGQEWFITRESDWLGNLERTLGEAFLTEKPEARKRALAVHPLDTHTLVVADIEPMRAFLELEGKPELKAQPAAPAPGKKDADSKRYLTIDPALKQALDRVESKPALVSAAWLKEVLPVDPLKKMLNAAPVAAGLKELKLDAGQVTKNIEQLRSLGLSVQFKDTMQIALAFLNKDEEGARFWDNTLKDIMTKAPVVALFKGANVNVTLAGGAAVGATPGAAVIKIDPLVQPPVWLVDLDVKPNDKRIGEAVEEITRPAFVQFRTMSEMAGGQDHLQELASALRQMTAKLGGFPRGTADRSLPARRTRPYDPIDRVSWMAELLPYLGDYATMYQNLDMNASWKEKGNADMGAIPVPAFLAAQSPEYPQSSWWRLVITSAGEQRFATTHFVGIAGVGPDAAEYDAGDARAGVFGYNRATKLAEISDGAANTIAILQVPPQFKRPWIAGGGATVMGVPLTGSIKPFLVSYKDKAGKVRKGAVAIMADGSVRFIPETITDASFKGLCTIHGGEKIDVEKETELIHAAGGAELKAKN
jgi:hypothetical protein